MTLPPPHSSPASFFTSASQAGKSCRLGERSGAGPSTAPPAATSSRIFFNTAGRIVADSGSTSSR